MIAPASRFSNVAGAVTVTLGARSRQLGIVSGRPNASASSSFILRLVPGSRTTAWRLSDQVRFGEDAESPRRTSVTSRSTRHPRSGQARSTPGYRSWQALQYAYGLKIWTCPQTSRRLDRASRLHGSRFRVNFGAACSANEGGYFLISTFLSACPARTDQFLFKADVSVAVFFANSLVT